MPHWLAFDVMMAWRLVKIASMLGAGQEALRVTCAAWLAGVRYRGVECRDRPLCKRAASLIEANTSKGNTKTDYVGYNGRTDQN